MKRKEDIKVQESLREFRSPLKPQRRRRADVLRVVGWIFLGWALRGFRDLMDETLEAMDLG